MLLLRLALLPLLVWTWLCSPVHADTAGRVLLQGDRNEYLLSPHLTFLADPEGRLGLDEVLERSAQFAASPQRIPNFGITATTYWVKLTISNGAAENHWLLEHADVMYQYLDLWIIRDGVVLDHKQGGSMRPRSADTVRTRGHVFALSLPPGSETDLYLRAETGYVQFFPLRLWTAVSMKEHSTFESMLHGTYIGVALAMMLYNLFVYVASREKSYLTYIGYMIAMFVIQCYLNGFFFMLFPDSDPSLDNRIFMAGYELAGVFAAAFTYHFLRLTKIEKAVIGFFILWSCMMCLTRVLGDHHHWSQVLQVYVGCISPVLLVIGIRKALTGDVPSRFYVVGFGWYLMSIGVFTLTTLNVLPFGSLTYYSVSIGCTLEAVLLSLALAQRVEQVKKESERLAAAQLRAQNALLEAQAEASRAREEALLHEQKALEQRQIALEHEKQLMEKEKFANLGVLSAGIAHEINNPNNFMRVSAQTAESRLRTLQTFTHDLMGDEPDQDIAAAFDGHFSGIDSQLRLILEGSDRISGIVNSMRRASRQDAGEGVLFDPVDSVLSTVALIRPSFRSLVEINTDGLEPGHRIHGHPSRLDQVFTNLIVNACHAIEEKQTTMPGAGRGLISISSACRDGWIDIAIRDNGCGMTDDTRARLFQPFFTTKGSEKGTGLGLGICQSIVTEHGGTLEADSVYGTGTTFHVVLPEATPG